MTGYTAHDVAKLLRLSVGRVRAYARAGFLEPARGRRGEYRFSFQDVILLRTAKGLLEAKVPPRRVRRALRRLREQLPKGRPLSAVRIAAHGDEVVVRDGSTLWSPESGQVHFDFEVADLAEQVAPLARRAAEEAREAEEEMAAEDWYEFGCELEATAPEQARDAYRRALELDPAMEEARLNLGRLLHDGGQLRAAEAHFRVAAALRPDDATASYNLGVALEDLGRLEEAIEAYERAIAADAGLADAHFNLARLLERTGRGAAALRHLMTYRKLTEEH